MEGVSMIRERYVSLLNAFGNEIAAEPSKIRIEQPFKSGVGEYRFDIKKIVDNLREKSLDRNDVFVPNFMGVLFGFQDKRTPSAFELISFAPINDGTNPSIFPVGFKKPDANALYNGRLNVQVDNTVVFSSYPTENFRHVPQTQGEFLAKSDDSALQTNEQIQGSIKDKCELVIPRVLLAGTRDIRINVSFDAAGLDFATSDDTNLTPVLVFYMDGFLIKNGCEKGIGVSDSIAPVVGKW